MFISISTMDGIKAGETLVLKVDRAFGLVGAYAIDGTLVGYVSETQPDGCLDVWNVYSRIGDNRVLCKAAIVFGGTVILSTDSPVFGAPRYERIERAGIGILAVRE